MSTDRKLRADAVRNREQIIAAAHTLIAEHGTELRMDEVARHAGVGPGTLYRRFPNRQALIREVALDSFHQVITIARTAEDEEPDAWSALARFVHQSGSHLRVAAGLATRFAGGWTSLRDDPENIRLRRTLLKIIDRMIHRAQADGDLRSDVDAADVAMILSLLLRPPLDLQVDLTGASTDRYLAVMLDGLRTRPDAAPLPSPEITLSDLM